MQKSKISFWALSELSFNESFTSEGAEMAKTDSQARQISTGVNRTNAHILDWLFKFNY